MMNKKEISKTDIDKLMETLERRFDKNMKRHIGLRWEKIKAKIERDDEKSHKPAHTGKARRANFASALNDNSEDFNNYLSNQTI